MVRASNISDSMLFRVVAYPSTDTPDLIVAHCLELNLVGTGDTLEDAVSELLGNIEAQIAFCAEHNAELLCPAPKSVWDKYRKALHANLKIPVDLAEKIRSNGGKKASSPKTHFLNRIDRIVATKRVFDACLASL